MKTITSWIDFQLFTASFPFIIACDVETAKDSILLGVSFSDGASACYIPIHLYNTPGFEECIETNFKERLKDYVSSKTFIGHNFTYDKRFIDAFFNISSKWIADTRIMWHLASAPSGPRPYGLKDAQIDLLGWEKTNESEIKAEVESKGGSLKKGDHYLACVATLSRYACYDTISTYRIYRQLNNFFERYDYKWLLDKMMQYNELLELNTRQGIKADLKGLEKSHNNLLKRKLTYEKIFRKLMKEEIEQLEDAWKDRKKALYKREYNRVRYENHPEEWERFNLNSDKHKRELFFDKLRLECIETTPGGQPKTSSDSVKAFLRLEKSERLQKAFISYLNYEKAHTLTSNFSGPYIGSCGGGRLHPGFNICGTVSYRLSGFKPYLLNAPFNEKSIMQHFKCDEGYIGLHADLSAIEPTITAAFSEDESLLKVFKHGKGDIYLDLALELFNENKELKTYYDPSISVTKSIKTRFERERNIAKVIQLAVQYTGTKYTVSKNLSKEGIETSEEQASHYVDAYWRKFKKIARWENQLRELNRSQGYLRNAIGRIIRVPDPEYKDLSNRFIQSSAHDVLILWVLEIYRLSAKRGITCKPVILDIHDSTSNQCLFEHVEQLEQIYKEALQNIENQLGLNVPIKMEMKRFSTLAGLKGNE